jgi:predicted nucleic-acid-binding Zn-ribbon protein
LSEAKKCPKCGGQMESGIVRAHGLNPLSFASKEIKGLLGAKVTQTIAYSCKVCGYVEIYRRI